eukprot:scaffold2041_cov251-Pinguiococcus_pyrenoidosus.AAC.14
MPTKLHAFGAPGASAPTEPLPSPDRPGCRSSTWHPGFDARGSRTPSQEKRVAAKPEGRKTKR